MVSLTSRPCREQPAMQLLQLPGRAQFCSFPEARVGMMPRPSSVEGWGRVSLPEEWVTNTATLVVSPCSSGLDLSPRGGGGVPALLCSKWAAREPGTAAPGVLSTLGAAPPGVCQDSFLATKTSVPRKRCLGFLPVPVTLSWGPPR